MKEYIEYLLDNHLSYIKDLGFRVSNTNTKLIYISKDKFKWDDVKYDVIPFSITMNNSYEVDYILFRMTDRLFKYFLNIDELLVEKFPEDLDLNNLNLIIIKVK